MTALVRLTFAGLLRMEDGDNLQTEVPENISLEAAAETFYGVGKFGGIDIVDGKHRGYR
jgi:hypothetical protein